MAEKSGQGDEPTPSTCSPPSVQHSSPQDETKETESKQRETRMKKDDLYMVLALWMETFPVMEQRDNAKQDNKVGVVFVLPTDRVLTADCSRDGVHGVARVLINHCGKLEGCKVFVSRKPCSLCAKLLVQSRVLRLFYLPTQPELDNEKELERVDNLFKTSSVGQSVLVPCVDQRVLDRVKREVPEEITPHEISKGRDELFEKWWSGEWSARAQKALHWPWLKDKMEIQVKKDFKSLMEWIAVVKAPMDKGVSFRMVTLVDRDDAATSVFSMTSIQLAT